MSEPKIKELPFNTLVDMTVPYDDRKWCGLIEACCNTAKRLTGDYMVASIRAWDRSGVRALSKFQVGASFGPGSIDAIFEKAWECNGGAAQRRLGYLKHTDPAKFVEVVEEYGDQLAEGDIVLHIELAGLGVGGATLQISKQEMPAVS